MTDNWKIEATQNASKIDDEIISLSNGHWNMLKRDYQSFWAHAKNIPHLFKQLKPLNKSDRESLWSRYSSICKEAKEKQQSDNKDRKWKSESIRNDIFSEISTAEVNTFFGFDNPDVDEMKRLSKVLARAGRMLSNNKNEMMGEHKQECFKRIQKVREAHDAWWKGLKSHRHRSHEGFQSRTRENLNRNRERLRKSIDAQHSCERSADKLRDNISSSWNDDWAYDARGWLSDLENKISDIKSSISDIEGWIKEDEAKLR